MKKVKPDERPLLTPRETKGIEKQFATLQAAIAEGKASEQSVAEALCKDLFGTEPARSDDKMFSLENIKFYVTDWIISGSYSLERLGAFVTGLFGENGASAHPLTC